MLMPIFPSWTLAFAHATIFTYWFSLHLAIARYQILFFPDLVDIRDTTFLGHVFGISTFLFSSQVQGFFFIFTMNQIVAVPAQSFLNFILVMMVFEK